MELTYPPPMAAIGPTLPTWAPRQVGSYLGYTGRNANIVAEAALDPQLTFSATTRERIILHFSREPHARHILPGPVANGYRGLQVAAQVRGADTGVHADQARRDACTRNCSPAGTDIVAMRPPDSGGRISCAF